MDEEALHQLLAQAIDASFALTMALNTYGTHSEEAAEANKQYEAAMAAYKEATTRPFVQATHWDNFCSLHPEAEECRVYDV
jgi:hypothetical protein